MQTRASKNYLVIGSAHQGVDNEVLKVIKQVCDYYNATPVHVGPLVTQEEVQMYNRRIDKLRTWEKQNTEKLTQQTEEVDEQVEILYAEIEKARHELANTETLKEENALNKQIEIMNNKIEQLIRKNNEKWNSLDEKLHVCQQEIQSLIDAQKLRITTLKKFLPDIHFVINKEIVIPEGLDIIEEKKLHDQNWRINSNISITATPANGDKVFGAPITKRTFRMLQKSGISHIIPHMTPHTKTFPRPGLNHAFNFITTGGLKFLDFPERITDTYKAVAAPSMILLTIDNKIDEFHPSRIRIKRVNKNMIALHDGLLFTSRSVKELKSSEKACFITDSHAPYTHAGVIQSMRCLNLLHKPSVFIDGGDTGDMESISRHTEMSPGSRENLRLKNDLDSILQLLHAYANKEEFSFIKNRIMLDSNHHEWLTMFVDKNPALKGMLDWETLSKTMFHDWTMFIRKGGADQYYKFGDLCMKHGDKETTVSGFEIYNNYLAGHSHTYDEYCDSIKVGPACRLGPKYLQNAANSWQNNITSITKYNNVTCKHPKIVLHSENKQLSRFCYRGVIYEVKYYKY